MSGRLHLLPGDCLELLHTIPDASVDAIVTDPPYGLSDYTTADLQDCMRAWLSGDPYRPQRRGFMGREWDAFVPGPEVWRECLRVLRPGGHLLAFAAPRTQHLMALGIELAGFEIRDLIAWVTGSGFPKSKNIALSIDKGEGLPNRGRAIPTASAVTPDGQPLTSNPVPPYQPQTPEAAEWEGWGTALKPAIEPITLARKPLEGTLAANILKHGTGALNIDGCRVPTIAGEAVSNHSRSADAAASKGIYGDSAAQGTHQTAGQQLGRWPADLILGHNPDCCPDGSAEIPAGSGVSGDEPSAQIGTVYSGSGRRRPFQPHGQDGRETVAVWRCSPGCPVASVAEQSGVSTAGVQRQPLGTGGIWTASSGAPCAPQFGDTGTAARFFMSFQPDPPDILIYVPKVSRSEREAGCEAIPPMTGSAAVDREEGSAGAASPRAGSSRTAQAVHNNHPTVKPIKLMRYLCRLIARPGQTVLDPFCGSGSTGIGALLEGCSFIGIEREARSLDIAAARIRHHTGEAPHRDEPEVEPEGPVFAADGRQAQLWRLA